MLMKAVFKDGNEMYVEEEHIQWFKDMFGDIIVKFKKYERLKF